jgi:RNA polymerase sigma-70 factor (ECF subfamily)
MDSAPATWDSPMTSLAILISDEVAFRDWYDRTLPHVYRYLLSRCAGDQHLAEELTQQTFIEAVRHAEGFDGRSSVVTWLCGIGRHKLVDYYRRSGRDARRGAQLVLFAHRDAWREVETRDAVEYALGEIAPDQRLALIFRYLDGLPVRDVAGALGRTESATESLLSRARESFRRAYEAQTDA